jgi:hypothetical protein
MQRKRSTKTAGRPGNALSRAHLIVTAVNGPQILVEIPGWWHDRMLSSTLHRLAAAIELDSEGCPWTAVCEPFSARPRQGSVSLKIAECRACNGNDRLPDEPSRACRYCGGKSADVIERALNLLNAVATEYNNGRLT